jgi:hypothetical protein
MTITIYKQPSLFVLRFLTVWSFLVDVIIALITLGIVETNIGGWANNHFNHVCAHIQKTEPITIQLNLKCLK